MGYAVYKDYDALSVGVERWAGYGVPAECDWPDCTTEIDRGLGYKCEEHGPDPEMDPSEYASDPEFGETTPGCGLFFCSEHRYRVEEHEGLTPKPDHRRWKAHMLVDPSWMRWRIENPEKTERMMKEIA